MSRADDLQRINEALEASREVLSAFTPGEVDARQKKGAGPVTEADLKVDALLRRMLPQEDEGWLSEETADSPERLDRRRVWVVDPIDGTKEFVRGRPEWCVSVGLVEDGVAVAGGILNPETDQLVLGALETGVTLNGVATRTRECDELEGAVVLASRSEYRRGEWEHFEGIGFVVERMGSVAWKLALVAAGKADATWTLKPKNEWDVVAGVALVHAAGGRCFLPFGGELSFNLPDPKLRHGLAATAAGLASPIAELLAERE